LFQGMVGFLRRDSQWISFNFFGNLAKLAPN
jgi:hypothetical protein